MKLTRNNLKSYFNHRILIPNFFFFFWPCGPLSPLVKAQSVNHWIAKEVLTTDSLKRKLKLFHKYFI